MRRIAITALTALSLAAGAGFAIAQDGPGKAESKAEPGAASYGTGTAARTTADDATPPKQSESSYGTGTASRASSAGPTEQGARTGATCTDGKTPGPDRRC